MHYELIVFARFSIHFSKEKTLEMTARVTKL
jgi:hypothetical protein